MMALPESPQCPKFSCRKKKSRRGQGRCIPHPISNGPVNLDDQERPSSGWKQCNQQQEEHLPPMLALLPCHGKKHVCFPPRHTQGAHYIGMSAYMMVHPGLHPDLGSWDHLT